MFIERKRWSPDAFFYDAFLDVTALEVYIGILEVDLPGVIENQRKQIWQDVKDGDEEAQYYACLAEHELDSGVSTRLLTGTALIAIWATYESVIKRRSDIRSFILIRCSRLSLTTMKPRRLINYAGAQTRMNLTGLPKKERLFKRLCGVLREVATLRMRSMNSSKPVTNDMVVLH